MRTTRDGWKDFILSTCPLLAEWQVDALVEKIEDQLDSANEEGYMEGIGKTYGS